MERMKAYVCEKYGPPEVLQLKEVEKPVPGDKEMLIKVHASSVNGADLNSRGLVYVPPGLGFLARLMMGFKKPKIGILGSVLAGEVVEVGKDIQLFQPGDKVIGTGAELGGYGEYACSVEDGDMINMPGNISYEEASTLPYGALTALYFLQNKANVRSGQKVLVRGASGGVGSYAAQLARHMGAEVTGICSTKNVEFVKSLGAHKVIDYTKEDVLDRGEKWDIIFDVVVGKTSFKQFKRIMNPKGYYLAVAGGLNDLVSGIWTSIIGGKRVIFGGGTACEIKENLLYIKELVESGEIKITLDKTYPFEQMVEAHRYAESGNKKGSVAVRIA